MSMAQTGRRVMTVAQPEPGHRRGPQPGDSLDLPRPDRHSGNRMAWFLVPAHVNETTDPVDNLGGICSVVLVAALILGINFAVVPNSGALVAGLAAVTVAGLVAFVIRQRRASNPLYDLHVAARPTFWVAAAAGIIVFGSLMGAMFIGQQFPQNVLGYSTVQAGAAILPAAIMMVSVAPRPAKQVAVIGSRLTFLAGYLFVFLGFLTMLLLWREGSSYWEVGLGYALVGTDVGFAQTPAAHSLTGSVLPTWVGMASATADLQRDLGGALMQSIFGALLTAGYAAAFTAAIAASPERDKVIFYSDRGCQYTCAAFAGLASDCAVRLSHGRTGRCWDNALAESFFASLKGELLDLQPWRTRAAAR